LITSKITLYGALASLLLALAGNSPAQTEQVSYSPGDVKIVGVLDYGHTSPLVEQTAAVRYSAFVFNGNGNDQVEVTVTGDRTAFIAVADPSLNLVARGIGHLTVSLPNRGPDAEAFYVVFKGQPGRPARVILRKTGGAPPAADATR